MLRNPYYMGVVPYRGVYHEGKHEPIVSVELWLRVQDVLTAHHLAGEKERKHPTTSRARSSATSAARA
jgi:site-specific DNA recombinase